MSLTTCPDCGKEISTSAAACPGCGRPMAAQAKPWVVKQDGTEYQVATWEELSRWIAERRIRPDAQIQEPQSGRWMTTAEVMKHVAMPVTEKRRGCGYVVGMTIVVFFTVLILIAVLQTFSR